MLRRTPHERPVNSRLGNLRCSRALADHVPPPHIVPMDGRGDVSVHWSSDVGFEQLTHEVDCGFIVVVCSWIGWEILREWSVLQLVTKQITLVLSRHTQSECAQKTKRISHSAGL